MDKVYPVLEVRQVNDNVSGINLLGCFSSEDKALAFIKEQNYDDEPVLPLFGVICRDTFDESTGTREVKINELTVTLVTGMYEVR